MSDSGEQSRADDPWGVVPQRLRPPVLRPDVLTRDGLVERLTRSEATVVAARAGAGYGKTTLMAQWASADRRPTAWVGLDPSDNDPVILCRHIVRSLGDSGRDVAEVEDLLASREPQVDRSVLPALGRALDHPDPPFLLVLDDVHLLERPDAVSLAERLLDMVPPSSTVAVAGRSLPQLRAARRLLDGTMLELRQDDLAFTDQEAMALIRQALPEFPLGAADQIVRQTEHWPAGLHLGVLAMRDHPDPPVAIQGLLSRDRRLAEYLHEEVLDRATPEVRDFLLRVAVLDRLSGGLCDQVLDRRDSRALLEQLTESGNLFVVRVDSDPDAFRLHQVFAELLVAHLERTDPDEVLRIRRRAAAWHDEHGESDPAVRQALATGDLDLATVVLYRQLFTSMVRGEVASLERWISAFPAPALRTNGLLALCAGWLALTQGLRDDLERHLAAARATTVPGVLPDGTVTYEVALAALEMTAGLDGAKASAESAAVVRAAGPTGSPWWGMARLLEAVSLVAVGAVDPLDVLPSVEFDTRGLVAVHAVTVAQLGVAQLQHGDSALGQSTVGQAVEELRTHRLETYTMSQFVHAAASYAAALRGDSRAAASAAADARGLVEMSAAVVARAGIHFRLLLAESAILRRSTPEAAPLLREVSDLLVAEPDAVVLREWAERLQIRLDDLRRRPGVVELSNAEQRVLELLVTHRSLGEIGTHLFVSRNTVKTHTLSIYRKLSVSSRSEAVDRARELGLLDTTDGG